MNYNKKTFTLKYVKNFTIRTFRENFKKKKNPAVANSVAYVELRCQMNRIVRLWRNTRKKYDDWKSNFSE